MMADPSLELAGISTTDMTEMESWTEAAISRILLRYINILSSWFFSAGGNGPVGSRRLHHRRIDCYSCDDEESVSSLDSSPRHYCSIGCLRAGLRWCDSASEL
jgi:hypothetical protein